MVVVSFFVLGVYVLSESFVFSSHVFQDECKENKKLDQQILITPMVDIPPYFIIKRDRGTKAIVSFGGIAVDFLSWLAEYSHFQYLDPADPTEYEKYGVVPLLLKSLLKKDSDIIPFVTLNVGREIQYLDYSFPIAITNYRFMLPYPEEEQRNNISAIFLPMDAMVWLMIAMTMVGLVVYMSFYNRFYQHLNASESTMTNAIIRRILYAFGLFSGRSSSGNFFVLPYNSSLSIRFIVGLLGLMTVILFNGYTTALTSFLTVQKLNPVVNSFQELASSKQYHLVAPLLSFMSTFFLNATTEPFKALGNSLRQNPHLLITKFPESLTQKLLEYNGVYAHVEPEIQGRIGYDMKSHKGQCRFTASNPLELAMPYYTVLRKGDPFIPTINEGTIRIWEFGLAQYWISSYVPSIDKCLIQDKQTLKDELRRWKPLTLEQLSGSFLLLVMGVLFALLIFILELLWNKLWGQITRMIRELLAFTLVTITICIITSPTIIQAACYYNGETGESFCDVYIKWEADAVNTEVSWAPDCTIDIEGNDLKTVSNVSDKSKCGELCFKNSKCTHFTFTKVSGATGRCAMKANVRTLGQQPKKSPGSFCGYISTRTDFAWNGK